MDLENLGWTPSRQAALAALERTDLMAARVAFQDRGLYGLYTEAGEGLGQVSGRLKRAASGPPAVGDWVGLRPPSGDGRAVIEAILPRQGVFSRKTAGAVTKEQVVAANIDTVFLVCGLDGDFNPRRIERALLLAWESGARPVVILNKADVCPEREARVEEAQAAAPGVPVHVVSAREGVGVAALDVYLGRGWTVALVGSSGVGKSTLVNRLLGTERQQTREVRGGDSRGRHTTVRRELIPLPAGGVLVDTPGLRELQLWAGEAGLGQAFPEVEVLAAQCRFRDCGHQQEPDCAVRAALGDGALDRDRYASYGKLQSEVRALANRQDEQRRRREKQRIRSLHRLARRHRPRE